MPSGHEATNAEAGEMGGQIFRAWRASGAGRGLGFRVRGVGFQGLEV